MTKVINWTHAENRIVQGIDTIGLNGLKVEGAPTTHHTENTRFLVEVYTPYKNWLVDILGPENPLTRIPVYNMISYF